MIVGLQILVGWMAFVVIFALVTLGWAIYTGQLDEAEDARYIPFSEREPEAWPGRRPGRGGVSGA